VEHMKDIVSRRAFLCTAEVAGAESAKPRLTMNSNQPWRRRLRHSHPPFLCTAAVAGAESAKPRLAMNSNQPWRRRLRHSTRPQNLLMYSGDRGRECHRQRVREELKRSVIPVGQRRKLVTGDGRDRLADIASRMNNVLDL